MAQHRGFDYPSSWCRSGSGFVQTPADGEPPPSQPGSVGDLTGGATLAGAIAAALFRRERTGRGAVVDHALYLIGDYIMSQSLISASLGWQPPDLPRRAPQAPTRPTTSTARRTAAGWCSACSTTSGGRTWPASSVAMPGSTDPRYVDPAARAANNVDLIAEMDAIFATRTLAEWEQRAGRSPGRLVAAQEPGGGHRRRAGAGERLRDPGDVRRREAPTSPARPRRSSTSGRSARCGPRRRTARTPTRSCASSA